MISPISKTLNNYCPHCCTNSVELYTKYNVALNYAHMVETNEFEDTNNQISFFRCNECKTTFDILWGFNDNGVLFPYPLHFIIDQSILENKLIKGSK